MGIDIKGDLCAFMPSKILDGFDIYAPEQQVCDVCVAKDMRGHLISVHILPVGTDARIFPISQDIRTGYEMGFIRLFIQQLQQQEQAALIIFCNAILLYTAWGRISGPRSNLIPPRPH